MGSVQFANYAAKQGTIQSPSAAFNALVSEARYENGHGGYTGTIAEKSSFTLVGSVATNVEARELARRLLDEADERIDDKWGPAGLIEVVDPPGYYFFGWASC